MQQIDETTIPHTVTTVDAQPAIWIAGEACVRHDVTGEASNPGQMQRVVRRLRGRTDAIIPAWLMPEPSNREDPTAVVVWVGGGKVGYLPSDVAARWQPILLRLTGRYGYNVACRATLDPPSVANQGGFGIVVWLPTLGARPQPAAPSANGPSSKPPVASNRPQHPLAATTPSAQLAAGATELAPSSAELARLRVEIAKARTDLETAKRELQSVEEAVEIQSFGLYAPRYGFESSAQYVARLKGIRDEQQALIKAGEAAPCDAKGTGGGSAAERKKIVKQYAQLVLRAFNGECDAAIANVRRDNVTTLEQRLTKAYAEINKLGEVQHVTISRRYFDLKLAELHLVHEHREKLQQEKEEQKRIKKQMR